MLKNYCGKQLGFEANEMKFCNNNPNQKRILYI